MACTFAFHPELFEQRAIALEHLENHGLCWFEHFGSVDLCHDTCGLEVCGIRQRKDCLRILSLLRRLFPAWRHTRFFYQDWGRELGWRAIICRDED